MRLLGNEWFRLISFTANYYFRAVAADLRPPAVLGVAEFEYNFQTNHAAKSCQRFGALLIDATKEGVNGDAVLRRP